MKPYKYLTVLNFEQGQVHQYPIGNRSIDHEDIEERITELGHNLTNCEWMIHKNEPIIY
tara:strand:- start:260 stop:436 length:177 start_codon:yes stop_codon:yes gene_type:complete